VPRVAATKLEEVMVSEVALTTIEVIADLLWTGLLLSVTVTVSVTVAVKLNVPETVGAPEMVPLLARVRPAGKLPELTVQLYAGVPPLAWRVWE
jgi:hypothetical protein